MDLIEDAGVRPEEEEADSGNILINLSKLFPSNAGRATELRRNAPPGLQRTIWKGLRVRRVLTEYSEKVIVPKKLAYYNYSYFIAARTHANRAF